MFPESKVTEIYCMADDFCKEMCIRDSVSRREHEIEDFTLVIDYQMQLESEEPSHRTSSTLGTQMCIRDRLDTV